MTAQPQPLSIGARITGDAVMLASETRCRHPYIVSQTGTGKSTLLLNLIAQDFAAGEGLARSTRYLLNTLAPIAGKGAGFRSIGDTWADTTTPHGRLMLTVLGGPRRVRARADPRSHRRRTRPRQGARREARPQTQTASASEARDA
jgi:hypothetical protein